MRSFALAIPFAAVAFAQQNPFETFLSQTDSRGVVTGQPDPVTTQPLPVTTQPAPVTTPASFIPTGPSGIPVGINTSLPPAPSVATDTTLVQVPIPSGAISGIIASASSAVVGDSNSTVTTPTPRQTTEASGTNTRSVTATLTTGTQSATSDPAATGAAGMVKPMIGLGVAGAIFAAFL
jgi:hypothetical protein